MLGERYIRYMRLLYKETRPCQHHFNIDDFFSAVLEVTDG